MVTTRTPILGHPYDQQVREFRLGKEVSHMQEMNSVNNSQGGNRMKKMLLALSLSFVLVFGFASSALAADNNSGEGSTPAAGLGNSISQGTVVQRESGKAEVAYPNKGYLGYLIWSSVDATTNTNYGNLQIRYLASNMVTTTAQASGPHANYTINTMKCAVCHSVHMAPVDSFVLTNVKRSSLTSDAPVAAGSVCAYCHSVTGVITEHRVSVATNGNLQGHTVGRCSSTGVGACHGGAHGVGVSAYETLASKLLNAGADDNISEAIAASATTGMIAADFDIATGNTMTNDQNTFAVGYLCAQCHQASAMTSKPGYGFVAQMAGRHGSNLPTVTPGATLLSTHPMLDSNATATASYDTTGTTAQGRQIAWAPANGCVKCHSKVDPTLNQPMFPHATADNYASNGGTNNVAAYTSGDWLMTSSFAGSDDTTAVYRRTTDNLTAAATGGRWGTAFDGVCLNCHRTGAVDGSGDATGGVGIDY